MVRKVRWAFEPTPKIADNLNHPWFESRKEAWSALRQLSFRQFQPRLSRRHGQGRDFGIKITEESRSVLVKLYNDGLLPARRPIAPRPPAPEKDDAGAFFQLFWQKGNNPSAVEYEFAEMWEHHKIKHYKALAHENPGGYTYSTAGRNSSKARRASNDEDTRLRRGAEIRAEAEAPRAAKRGDLFELDTPFRQAVAAGVGGFALLAGVWPAGGQKPAQGAVKTALPHLARFRRTAFARTAGRFIGAHSRRRRDLGWALWSSP